MADATRFSVMSKQIEDNKQATDELRSQMADLAKTQADVCKSLSRMDAMLSMLVSQSKGQTSHAPILNSPPSGCLTTSTTPPPADPPDRTHTGQRFAGNGDEETGSPNGLSTRLTKLGFPTFDGKKLRNWVYRCEQFFMLDRTPPEMKVRLASVYLDGEAFEWHRNYMNGRYGDYPLWPDYVYELTGRFGEDYDDPLSTLVKVKQGNDSVEKYLARFESALTMVSIPASHSLSIFMANMHPQLALHVRQFATKSVSEAAKFARLHESYLHYSPMKQDRAPFSPYTKTQNTSPLNTPPKAAETSKTQPYEPSLIPKKPQDKYPRKYSFQEMDERKAKGLCMYCDEPFTPGHQMKHRRSHIYVMDCEEEDNCEAEKGLAVQVNDEVVQEQLGKIPTISVNALSGSSTFDCMRLMGEYGKRKLHILIDPGSTHNFLDLKIAKLLGCELEAIKPMSVAAALGNQMVTSYKCANFSWKVQGYTITTEVRTLPLDCCDLVLGVQWLITLGPINWDFKNLRMEFTLGGVKHVLRGLAKTGCKEVKGSDLSKPMAHAPQIALLQLQEVSAEQNHQSLNPEAMFCHISVSGDEFSNDSARQSLPQPLSIPNGVWESTSMNLVEGLPLSKGKHCFLVVVDRLSKNAHFLALSHPHTAVEVAQVYLDQVFKLHGMPKDIVTDRDLTILSEVWQEMFRVHGTDLMFSTPYNPQIEGQTEVTNRTLETYLRCMTADSPHTWSTWLPLVEWWYNTTYHTAIQSTPFEAIYGQPPPLHLPYLPGESPSATVDRSLQKREEVINMLKLSPRFYGPFHVVDKIGQVAYKLDLLSGAAIRDGFHEPEAVLDKKVVKYQNKAVTKVLVQWKGQSPSQATWEFYSDFISKFPSFSHT